MITIRSFILVFLFISTSAFAQKSTSDFVFTIKTDNPGGTNAKSYYLRTQNGETYNYDVDWDNDGVFDDIALSTPIVHRYSQAGTYTIRIRGQYPRLNFTIVDHKKLISVDQWGDQVWTSMNSAFFMCSNLKSLPIDTPNLSQVTSMRQMFYGTDSLNADISFWDVSNVEDMTWMFYRAKMFNCDLSNWDVRRLKSAIWMFNNATSFNQSLANWNIDSLAAMQHIFDNTAMSADNYDSTLIAWSSKAYLGSVTVGAAGLKYCKSIAARQLLISKGWNFIGDTQQAGCLITAVEKKEFEANEFEMYPNPTNGYLNIRLSNGKGTELNIYNNLGQLVFETTPKSNFIELDLNHLDNGIYFVRYGNKSKRIIIQK